MHVVDLMNNASMYVSLKKQNKKNLTFVIFNKNFLIWNKTKRFLSSDMLYVLLQSLSPLKPCCFLTIDCDLPLSNQQPMVRIKKKKLNSSYSGFCYSTSIAYLDSMTRCCMENNCVKILQILCSFMVQNYIIRV